LLKPRHIYYFEDPFGKERYEKRESLEHEIRVIVNSVRKVNDVYVIITSREEVFKEFKKESLSAEELERFERSLNIKKPSYDYGRRMEMLLLMAEDEGCAWLEDEELKKFVLEAIRSKWVLPTLLSMKDFVKATVNVKDWGNLEEELMIKSEKTSERFAKEIIEMSDDKVLFLCFAFMELKLDVAKETYEKLAEKIDGAWEFDKVLKWFKGNKVGLDDQAFIRFSHPSYSEAFRHAAFKIDYSGRVKRIFCNVLLELAEKDEAAWSVAEAVAENFDKLPEDVRNILFRLAEKDETSEDVARAMYWYFDKLSDDVRDELLLRLADKEEATRVVKFVVENFDKMSDDLILRLAEKDKILEILYRL